MRKPFHQLRVFDLIIVLTIILSVLIYEFYYDHGNAFTRMVLAFLVLFLIWQIIQNSRYRKLLRQPQEGKL